MEYLVMGVGYRRLFNGYDYAQPEKAVVELAEKMAKVFKKIMVIEMTESGPKPIYKAPEEHKKAKLPWTICPRK